MQNLDFSSRLNMLWNEHMIGMKIVKRMYIIYLSSIINIQEYLEYLTFQIVFWVFL